MFKITGKTFISGGVLSIVYINFNSPSFPALSVALNHKTFFSVTPSIVGIFPLYSLYSGPLFGDPVHEYSVFTIVPIASVISTSGLTDLYTLVCSGEISLITGFVLSNKYFGLTIVTFPASSSTLTIRYLSPENPL